MSPELTRFCLSSFCFHFLSVLWQQVNNVMIWSSSQGWSAHRPIGALDVCIAQNVRLVQQGRTGDSLLDGGRVGV